MRFKKKFEIPEIIQHPGFVLKNELENRDIKLNVFCNALDISPSMLSDVCNGKKDISEEMALKLEKLFFGQAEYWVITQALFKLNSCRGVKLESTDE